MAANSITLTAEEINMLVNPQVGTSIKNNFAVKKLQPEHLVACKALNREAHEFLMDVYEEQKTAESNAAMAQADINSKLGR